MGSAKSGGDTPYSWNYFANIAGVVCLGPVDELVAVIIDGIEVWPLGGATLVRGTEAYVSIFIATPTTAYGNLHFYWGTDQQIEDPVLRGGRNNFDEIHPPYKGICYIMLGYWAASYPSSTAGGFLFGNERLTAPNIEVVVRRKPAQTLLTPGAVATVSRARAANVATVVTAAPHGLATGDAVMIAGLGGTGYNKSYAPVTVVNATTFTYPCTGTTETTAADTGGTVSLALADKQANLLAFAAEVLTTREGLLLGNGALDPTTFAAGAVTLQGRSAIAAASPLLDSRKTFRSFASDLCQMIDGWMRYNAVTGLIETGVYAHGTVPSVDWDHTITSDKLVQRPVFRPSTWDEVATEAWVDFVDRQRAYKRSSDMAPDGRARLVLGWDQPLDLQRPWITRRTQAIAHASETLRTAGRPQTSGTLSVRREHARLIKPGDYVLVDIQLEPGGAALYGYFRVKRRRVPFTGPIELELLLDETISQTPYAPAVTEPTTEAEALPEITHVRIIESPGDLAPINPSVILLPERPNLQVVGAALWYDSSETGTFQSLGFQTGFAVRATLRADLPSDINDPFFNVLKIAVPPQVDLTPLEDEIDQLRAWDDFLIFVITIAAGEVAEDASGFAKVELLAGYGVTLVGEGEYDLNVFRFQHGTIIRSFLIADSEVWIMRRYSASFPCFTHSTFSELRTNRQRGLTPDHAYFRVQPFTATAIRPLSDCPVI